MMASCKKQKYSGSKDFLFEKFKSRLSLMKVYNDKNKFTKHRFN